MRFITSTQRKAITEFLNQMRDTAQGNFERDGLCEPVAILMREGGNSVLPLGKIINHKDLTSAILNRIIEEAHPLAFVLVTEAWMAIVTKDAQTGDVVDDLEKKYKGHLTEPTSGGKEKPKAGVKEVVMLQCSSVAGDNFMLTADIVRNKGIKPVLKAWVRMENKGAEGRFVFDVTPLVERQ